VIRLASVVHGYGLERGTASCGSALLFVDGTFGEREDRLVRLWLCVTLCLVGAAANVKSVHSMSAVSATVASGCPYGKEYQPVRVLVANRLIRKATLGSLIAERQMYDSFILPCSERAPGALGDPADLNGLVAARDIFPSKQLARADFFGVIRQSLTSPVRAGAYASLTVTVAPRARCTIQVVYDGVASKAQGLGPKTGGRITWRWRVGMSTHPGRWPIVVRCGKSRALKLRIRVLPR
jgi:hypothetical protein